VDLYPGSTFVAYTDGLIERRSSQLDGAFERLCDAIQSQDVDRLCFAVMDRLVGKAIPEDDMALLAIRHLPGSGNEVRAQARTIQRSGERATRRG
jgi:serine phosphatase RsbU (regulator of sigma subunit)